MVALLLSLLAVVAADPLVVPHPIAPFLFDDPLLPLTPSTPPSEFDQARLVSAALYAESRLLERRREFPAALRRLQRAWRYQPQAIHLLPEIVALANDLQRTDETVRYALIAADQANLDPPLVRRLALRMSSQQRWHEALRLYQWLLQQTQVSAEISAMELGDALLWFDLGRICFLLQDYQQAAQYFSQIQPLIENPEKISSNPTLQRMLVGQADQTYLLLAESYFGAGRYDAAEAMYRKAHETLPDPGELDCQLARIAAKQGDDDQALRYLDRCRTDTPHRLGQEAMQLWADLLGRQLGEQAEETLLERLEPVARSADAPEAVLRFLAEWQKDRQRWDEAERWYLRWLDQQPDATAFAELCGIYRRNQQWPQLLDVLGRAAAAGLTLRDLDELSEQLVVDGVLVDQLLNEARQRLDADPAGTAASGALLAAVDLAVAAGRYQIAEGLFDVALQGTDDDQRAAALTNWGLALLIDRQYAQAVALFRRGVEDQRLADREAQYRYFLARALAWSGDIDQALVEAEAAAAAFAELPRLAALPAWILHFAKRYAESESAYRAVLQRFDDRHDRAELRTEMREIRLSLSNVCIHLEKDAAAEEWLEQILDEFPDDIGALNDLGYLWAEQGKNLRWARQMIRKAVDGDPENAAYLDSLGWVYYQLGKYAEAVHWLEKAAAADDEPDGVILDHLGDAYSKQDQPAQAILAWRRAVQAFDKAEEPSKRDSTSKKIQTYETCNP